MAEKKKFDVGEIESFEENVGKIRVPREEEDLFYYFHSEDLLDQDTNLKKGQFVTFNIEEEEESEESGNKASGVMPFRYVLIRALRSIAVFLLFKDFINKIVITINIYISFT